MGAKANVITTSQLERIRVQANHTEAVETRKKEELQRLKELSATHAAKWPNTLQASRMRKEQVAKDRVAAQEAAHAQMDRAEAAERAATRRLAIQRANKMLHDEADKVKGLHGRLLLSEVVAQNQTLVAHKESVAKARAAQDAAFVEQQKHALEAAEEAELRKLEQEKAKLMAQRKVQLQQLEHLKARILAERAADKAEGELIRRKAAEEAEELRQKETAWRAKMQAMNEATTAANATLQAFRAAEKERERLTDAAIEDYCKRKAAADAERAAMQASKEAAREARRKAQVELMERNYMAWHTKTAAALAADVQHAEDKAAADDEAQRLRRQQQWEAALRSNQQQLMRKAAESEALHEADRKFCEAWGVRLQQLRQEELQEAKDARGRALAVQRFQQWQAERKSVAKRETRRSDIQAALMAEAAVEEQQEGFRQYAQAVRNEAERRGLPLKPIDLYVSKKESPIVAIM